MDFEYSDEQKLLSETLRKFLNTGYGFDARAKIVASPSGWSEDVWAVLAEMGILGVPFDAEHGGFGGTTVDMMVVMEALEGGHGGEPVGPADAATAAAGYFNNRKLSIFGGSNEIQRNIITKMMLGL